MKKLRAKVRGTRPVGFGTRYLDERHGEMGMKLLEPSTSGSDVEHSTMLFSPPISASNSVSSMDMGGEENVRKRKASRKGRLVAVKMTPRRAPGFSSSGGERSSATKREKEEEEERTRVGFVREVEVLKVCFLFSLHPSILFRIFVFVSLRHRWVGRKNNP